MKSEVAGSGKRNFATDSADRRMAGREEGHVMRGHRLATWKGRALGTAILAFILLASTGWGYFFAERREMSLSGSADSQATFALASDNIGTGKGLYRSGNLVQPQNFITSEWRHNINRVSRDLPTIGLLSQFLNLDGFDYYLNGCEAYDGVWNDGSKTLRDQLAESLPTCATWGSGLRFMLVRNWLRTWPRLVLNL